MTPNPESTRYRIYALKRGKLTCLSETSKEGIGTAVIQHYEDGDLEGASVGILDRADPTMEGSWIVNPYTKGA